MNQAQVLEELRKIDFSYDYVTGGAALVLHGFRAEAPDIDIIVDQDQMNKLRETHKVLPVTHTRVIMGLFDIYIEEMEILREVDHLFGFPVASLKALWLYKEALNRPKDQEDLKFLRDVFMEENKNT